MNAQPRHQQTATRTHTTPAGRQARPETAKVAAGPRPQGTWLTMAQLKRRGWIWTTVFHYLGEGRREPNPYDQAGAPLRLYRLEDIEKAETDPRFHLRNIEGKKGEKFPATRTKATVRLARDEAAERRGRARERTLGGDFTLPVLGHGELNDLALAYLRNENRGWKKKAGTSDKLNVLRHNCSPYDQALNGGGELARTERASPQDYARILVLVLSAIRYMYPSLKGECMRRLAHKRVDGPLLLPHEIPGKLGEQVREQIAVQAKAREEAQRRSDQHQREKAAADARGYRDGTLDPDESPEQRELREEAVWTSQHEADAEEAAVELLRARHQAS